MNPQGTVATGDIPQKIFSNPVKFIPKRNWSSTHRMWGVSDLTGMSKIRSTHRMWGVL